MDFDHGTNETSSQKLDEMYENLTSLTKQLTMIQGFLESKYGPEFTTYCQFSEASSTEPAYDTTVVDTNSMQEDTEEYDKMPNLVSQESPSRTLGFVTVPLRQTGASGGGSSETRRRNRNSVIKEEDVLEPDNDANDMMYPLHNFSDLLDETEEHDATETPEFLELELDPSALLRGEPPALQPMFTSNNHGNYRQSQHGSNVNNNNFSSQSSKRSSSRQGSGSFPRFDTDADGRACSNTIASRRSSVGSSESSVSYKKYDCNVCGIKFEFAETLKSHMESHITGARTNRSNSEDSSVMGNSPMPLPRLMPRPSISVSDSPLGIDIEDTGVIPTKRQKIKKEKSGSQCSTSSSESLLSPSAKTIAALKRRKRYNQSRPCALKCPECDLPIRDKSRLIEHLRGHTGERPFECTVCEKAYTRRDVLKTHMIKMHGITPQFS